MNWKTICLLCLASIVMGVIVTLSIMALPWLLLAFPYVWAVWWVSQAAYARERAESAILRQLSVFQIESRTSYQNRPNPTWDALGGEYRSLLAADEALEVLKRDYRPQSDLADGSIVSQEWRIVQKVSGTEIHERCQLDLPETPEAKLSSALKRLSAVVRR